MAADIKVLLAIVDELDKSQRDTLMDVLKRKEEEDQKLMHKHELTELRGLGKELWRSIDVEAYLRREREW